jgi:D-alanyl-lipoteichoic acid acyltransferase DltB (MBOAT superfamily)
MLFNSFQFALFLPVVFLLYWFVFDYALRGCRHQLKWQNAFVVVASYVFYGWWDWRFLLLIAFTSLCSWWCGLRIQKGREQATSKDRKSKAWLILNVVINLLILAVFKYYDFFVNEFCHLFHISSEGLLIKVILPVGISFYTFQALSYTIDVYRGKMEPTRDIVAFFAFIGFFPQLVAGPIERATNLLPQFLQKREFSYEQAADGMRQILWGLFKKIVVADTCAIYVDQVFSTYSTQTGSALVIAAVLFTFQIYGDFSGYSDIAIGTAKLFGIRLMRNFNNPYFSRDIAEFWRRWHISLTTWFRDYVYIPMGGSRVGTAKIIRNTFVIFLLSGLWHGANWTFIVWGAYHALLFLPLILLRKNRVHTNQVAEGRLLPTWKEVLQMFVTFAFAVVGWVIFRSETITQSWEYLRGMAQWDSFQACYLFFTQKEVCMTAWLCILMLIVEWLQRDKQHGLEMNIPQWYVRYPIYLALMSAIIYFYGDAVTFIYFQF